MEPRRYARSPAGALATAAVLLTTALCAEGWSTFRADSLRTGNADGSELPRTLEVLWTFAGSEFNSPRIDSSPALAHGSVYVGVTEHSVFSPGGRIISLDAATGKLRWAKKARFPVFSSPSVAAGRVLVGEGYHQDSGCRLYCLDAARGEEIWSFETRSHLESSPQVEKDRVYFGAGDDGIYCLDLAGGKEIWHFPGVHVDLSPLVASGLVFAGTGHGGAAAVCLTADEGKLKWRIPLDLPAWGSPALLGNRLFLGLGNGNFLQSAEKPRGAVVCLAATSGKELWRREFPDAVLTAIASAGERLFAGCRDGHLYALDSRSGEVAWKRAAGGPILASPLLGGGHVAALGASGRLMVLSAETGEELAKVDLARLAGEGGRQKDFFASPSAAGGKIFLATGAGGLAALGKRE